LRGYNLTERTEQTHFVQARTAMTRDLVKPKDVVSRGLSYLKIDPEQKWSHEKRDKKFKKHYGACALTLATQWFDLCHSEIKDARLTEKEKKRGFRMFLMAHYFLWNYTRNADQLGATFGICECYARGKPLWDWIKHIAALEKRVIFWPTELDSTDTEVNILSIDGTDKKDWERKHETLPFDKKNYTQKHNHGGLKYQVTLAAHRPQCVDIFGPVRGGMGDKDVGTLTDSCTSETWKTCSRRPRVHQERVFGAGFLAQLP
jgi:hypothetical protein